MSRAAVLALILAAIAPPLQAAEVTVTLDGQTRSFGAATVDICFAQVEDGAANIEVEATDGPAEVQILISAAGPAEAFANLTLPGADGAPVYWVAQAGAEIPADFAAKPADADGVVRITGTFTREGAPAPTAGATASIAIDCAP